MSLVTRRAVIAGALGASLLPICRTESWAAQTVDALRLFVPAAPGGGWDGTARVIEKVLRETNAVKSVQLEHVPGAGGTVGLPRFVALRGRRDVLMVSGMTLVSSSIANRSAITVEQVTPIARLTGESHVLVVPAASPLRSLSDFVQALRADPQGTSVAGGSAGARTTFSSA